MASGTIKYDRDGAIAWVTVSNPEKRNAVSLSMWQQLDAIVAGVEEDVRCVILRGEGDRAFVSGADLSEFGSRRQNPDEAEIWEQTTAASMARLHQLPQLTVAMISGYCIGAGVALAVCCDVRLASASSQFGIPAARLGLGYGRPHIQRLREAVGQSHAIDMLASAARYDANQALAMGLVNRVYDDEHLLEEVTAYAAQIARNAPLTVRTSKQIVRTLGHQPSPADIELCDRLTAECFASEDYAEGVQALAEKHDPVFKGR